MDENRRRILDAAERLIVVHGIERVRLRDIAQEAKVSIGRIQHYFDNRDRVIEEMLSTASLRRVAEWSEVASDVDDPLEKLSLLLEHAIEDRARCIMWLATTSVASRNEQYLPDVGRIYDAWRHKLADVLEAGRMAGVFRPTGPVDEIVEVIICAIDRLMAGVAIELDGYTPERNARLLRNLAGLLLTAPLTSAER
ncbi:UNVERIFIED_ORG: AcrR family transcriptional regulator [Arthrobacter sp. UYEF10]